MSRAELTEIWQTVYGGAPPVVRGRELLENALAWHLQARATAGPSRTLQRKLRALAGAYAKGQALPELQTGPRLRPGTTLVKQWRGKSYTVTVLESGFAFGERTYASLSEIARSITGTSWNGPAFFGLRKGRRHAQVSTDAK